MLNQKRKALNQGIITIPFLLVLIIILFFILSFLQLALVLTHVSVTQYMSYSTARKFSLSAQDKEVQQDNAIAQYKQLRDQFFQPQAYTGRSGEWFFITKGIHKDDNLGKLRDQTIYTETNTIRKRFYGVNLHFITFILKLRIPFLIDDDRGGGVQVRVSSFLGRESSQDECNKFHEARAEKIKEECPSCQNIKTPLLSNSKGGDNGC